MPTKDESNDVTMIEICNSALLIFKPLRSLFSFLSTFFVNNAFIMPFEIDFLKLPWNFSSISLRRDQFYQYQKCVILSLRLQGETVGCFWDAYSNCSFISSFVPPHGLCIGKGEGTAVNDSTEITRKSSSRMTTRLFPPVESRLRDWQTLCDVK